MSNLFILIYSGGRGATFMKLFKGGRIKRKILGTSAIDYFTADARQGKNINIKRIKSFQKLCFDETDHL
jgi:hypothetical protein